MITGIIAGAQVLAAGRGEKSLVLWLREGARGSGERQK
jgi:hypothetical protein